MFKDLKLKFMIAFYPPLMSVWAWWSKIYRKIWNRQYKNVVLAKGLTPRAAQRNLNVLKWKPDSFKALRDSVSSPEYVQFNINRAALSGVQSDSNMDCDEFACWAANVIHEKFKPGILTVAWADKRTGKVKGHAVCLYRDPTTEFGHVGNWGHFMGFVSVENVADHVVNNYSEGELIGWCLFTPDLKKVKCRS